METATSDEHQQKLISSFMEIAVGQTMESAILFLKATNWNLEEAINLFLVHRHIQPLSYQNSSEQYWRNYQEQIPLPLPSIRDTLYDSSSMYHTPVEVRPEKIWDSKPELSDSASAESEDSRLSSLYRPPLKLLFKGSFEDAKSASSQENLWLLVNLQSTREFSSHTLNRDLWSNNDVSQAIKSSFILWQVYDDTTEGHKISTFYKIESVPPVVLLIDPITGLKMRSWSGAIEAQSFVEDLMNYIDVDAGPHEHIASLTRKKPIKTEKITCSSSNHTNQDMPTFRDDDFEESAEGKILIVPEKETCSSTEYDDLVEFLETMTLQEHEEKTCLEFPELTKEPKGDCDQSAVCSLCVRFPDGRRKQRRFLKSEPIQLLWSFCYSHMEESEKRAFKLVQAIPGASKTLDYGANATFDQSGLANSMISVTWE